MKKILALILAVTLVLMLVSCKKNKDEDPTPTPTPEVKLPLLLDIDLSAYIEIDESYYKNFDVEIKLNKVTELDVNNAIIQMLCANKDKTALTEGDGIISVGDVVNIFYKGYYLETNEQGEQTKVYFDGGSNIGGNSYALEIGSGGFIPGFEYNMIGKNLQDFAAMNHKKNGEVAEGDIITIKYSVARADNTVLNNRTAVIDLNDPSVNQKWGQGFADYFIGKNIGENYENLVFPTVCDGVSGNDVYYDVVINSAYSVDDKEKEVLLVEAYFPKDYHAANLQGKTSYFEVFVALDEDGGYKIEEYSAPELTETFVKETLKFTDEILADYEGETFMDKYMSYVVKALKWNGIDKQNATWTAFWESVLEGAVIKQLPEEYVTADYDEIMAEFNAAYESNSAYYTYDEYAHRYFSLSAGTDWKLEVRKYVEELIKQELIFYYVMDVEGLDPTAEEYEELFDKYLEKALAANNITIGNFNTEEEYLEHKKQYKAKLLETKGEDYFRETIYFSIGYDAIMEYANVVEITE